MKNDGLMEHPTPSSDVIKSINDVKVLPEQSNNGSFKATSKSNRTTVSSKSSNAKRILLLELEAMKKQNEIDEQLAAARRKAEMRRKQDEIDEQLAAARRKAEIRRKQDEIDTLTEKLEIANFEEESAKTKQVANLKKITSKWNSVKTDTITESDEAIATMQRPAGLLSDLQGNLELNKASYRT